MKQAKRNTIALLCCIGSAAVFAGVAIGGTFALFSSSKTVTNHLTVSAGLKAGLYLTSLEKDVLNDDGLITKDVVDLTSYGDAYDQTKGVDLSKYTGEIFAGNQIAPTMTGEANLRLYNTGDIAFDFDVTFIKKAYDAEGNAVDSAEILKQIEWNVETAEDKLVKKGEYSDIKVSYVFKNQENNNDVAGQSMSFDIIVKATQAISN